MSRENIKADLCIIGAGAAGLVTAAGAAMLGRKVVLFEAREMGGDCLNYGCVPSKAILAAAHAAHTVRSAAKLGVKAGEPAIDLPAVMAHVRDAIDAIEPNDSQERFEGLGVRIIREWARFTSQDTVESDSVVVKAKRFVIASGTRARIPHLTGLSDIPYLTNETIWQLDTLPRHLFILGGGPIGCELGQAFARLGAKVTILEANRLLGQFEPEHVETVRSALLADGIRIIEGWGVERFERADDAITITMPDGEAIDASHVLVAAGREPVFDTLGLEAAGVEAGVTGIRCDDRLRTANKRIYAAGDIAGKGALTHLAGWHGSVILRNLYYGVPTKQSSNPIPGCVYTSPGLAQIGLTEKRARDAQGDKVSVIAWPFHDNDRAIAEGDTAGGVKLVLGKGGKILGVHVAGARADDIGALAAVTMAKGGSVRDLTSPVLAYPTRGEAIKRAAGKHFEPVVFGPFAKAWAALLSAMH
ncbi:MAG: dihydrolipoyl dehydrogenase family protein [Caulobacterales bacterium]|uniref:dihydrolipoyl dehydrogenase family protein n=1 Tax=Glycocaulis sp. TaxID=1969725 RepID=UPI003FA05F20